MKTFLFLFSLAVCTLMQAQDIQSLPQIQIMPLGVFHFAYPNLDAIRVEEQDQISVLEEPYQSEIKAIAEAIISFRPTIIAIEQTPDRQATIDSLYALYLRGALEDRKNEIFQLGFRIGKTLSVEKIYCVDDAGKHYPHIEAIFQDPERLQQFASYAMPAADSVFRTAVPQTSRTSIIDYLLHLNSPEYISERLAVYLFHPFKYEETEGDFTGVDFETGRWYNRNLRIFRNIQRINRGPQDRILLIVGAEHLNLLHVFFNASREFELVSPVPYLQKAVQIRQQGVFLRLNDAG